MVRIEKVFLRIIIGRCRYHHKVGLLVGRPAIQRSCQIEFLFRKVLLDIFVLDRRLLIINQFHFFRYHIHSSHFMMLCQQCRNRQSYISGAGYSYLQILEIFHINFIRYHKSTMDYSI